MTSDRTVGESDMYGYTHYLYGEAYMGSYQGMRFRLEREPLKNVFYSPESEWARDGENEAHFLASVWPEPMSYEKTDKDKIEEKRFPFTEEGLSLAVKWLNNCYESRKEEWKQEERYFGK